jgi:hypothetical protein
MGKQNKEQTTPSEQWIDGVPPWTRMERFVRNYNRLPDENTGRNNDDDEEGEIVLDF